MSILSPPVGTAWVLQQFNKNPTLCTDRSIYKTNKNFKIPRVVLEGHLSTLSYSNLSQATSCPADIGKCILGVCNVV